MSCPTCGPPPPLTCPQCGPNVYPPRDIYINETVNLRTFGFGLNALKNNHELIPLVGVTAGALCWAVFSLYWAARTKPDVRFLRGNGQKVAPWEAVRPTQKLKLYIVMPKLYKPITELEELKREIGSWKP